MNATNQTDPRPLLCPVCPRATAFANGHRLKIHLLSATHFSCFPYKCAICPDRFSTSEELRDHHENGHSERSLTYLPPDRGTSEKRLQINGLVDLALARQRGLVGEAGDEMTVLGDGRGIGAALSSGVEGALTGDVDNEANDRSDRGLVPPASNVLRRTATAYPRGQLSTGPDHQVGDESGMKAEQVQVGNETLTCQLCEAAVSNRYTNMRAHAFGHVGRTGRMEVETQQRRLAEKMAACFPTSRVRNDMTCITCEVELTGSLKRAASEQNLHVQEFHLQRDLNLHCPIAECPIQNQPQPTMKALKEHVKRNHGGVGHLDESGKRTYREMEVRAEKITSEERPTHFPFTPICSRRTRQNN